MKSSAILVAALSVTVLGGCNIFEIDNYDAPTTLLTGRVVYQGEPVGVRSNGVQLELWQPSPEFELNQKIPIYVDQDGSFSAMIFDGDYQINLLANNGPWVSNTTRIPLTVSGNMSVDIPVVPHYNVRNPAITFNPTGGGPHGTIQATFTVDQIDTSRQLEYVGVYIGDKLFVDRNIGYAISNAVRERARTAIQTQLNTNAPITISVPLPANVYETNSPDRRKHVFVRVGVKTVGLAEMLFTPVQRIDI